MVSFEEFIGVKLSSNLNDVGSAQYACTIHIFGPIEFRTSGRQESGVKVCVEMQVSLVGHYCRSIWQVCRAGQSFNLF